MKNLYHDMLTQSCNEITTQNSKLAFQTLKKLTRYNPKSKVFDSKTGPLLGKYANNLKDKILINQQDIEEEIQTYLSQHFGCNQTLKIVKNLPIEFEATEIQSAINKLSTGKAFGINSIPDYLFSTKFLLEIYTQNRRVI